MSGMYVRFRGQGGKKVYALTARINGRQSWITIGKHGSPFTPETARKRANELRGQIAAGNDPASEREKARQTLTVAEITERFHRQRCGREINTEPFRFIPDAVVEATDETDKAELGKSHGRKPGKSVKAGTAREYWHLLRAYVMPAIGKLRANAVSIADLAKLNHDMIDTPRSANHMLACVS